VSRVKGPLLVLVHHAAGRHQDAAPAEQSPAARQPPERGLLRGPPPLDGLGCSAGSVGGRAHVDGHVPRPRRVGEVVGTGRVEFAAHLSVGVGVGGEEEEEEE